MTDKNGDQCCDYPVAKDNPKCSSVYHSCANIVITGKIPAADYVHSAEYLCGPYAPGTAKEWTLSNGMFKTKT